MNAQLQYRGPWTYHKWFLLDNKKIGTSSYYIEIRKTIFFIKLSYIKMAAYCWNYSNIQVSITNLQSIFPFFIYLEYSGQRTINCARFWTTCTYLAFPMFTTLYLCASKIYQNISQIQYKNLRSITLFYLWIYKHMRYCRNFVFTLWP